VYVKSDTVSNFSIVVIYSPLTNYILLVFAINLHTRLRVPVSYGSLATTIKQKARQPFSHFIFYKNIIVTADVSFL